MKTLCRPLLCATLAAFVPAQTKELRGVPGLLVVRGVPADVVLSEPMLDAIAADEALQKAIAAAAGLPVASCSASATLVKPTTPGTLQIRVDLLFPAGGAWSADTSKAVLAAAQKELQRSLDRQLFEIPREEVLARDSALQQRLRSLEEERTTLLRARAQGLDEAEVRLGQLRSLQQQELATRLEITTERAARDQLEKLRAETLQDIDKLSAKRVAEDRAREQVSDRLAEIDTEMKQIAATNDPKRLGELSKLGAELRSLRVKASDLAAGVAELERDLRVPVLLLEQSVKQMADTTLTLRRAEAKAEALQSCILERSHMLEDAQKRARALADLEASAEKLGTRIAPLRELVQETQGRLERLQQPRYELLPLR